MARLPSIPRRLLRLARLPGARRVLLIEAACWLLAARLALRLVPFPRLASRLGTLVPPGDQRALRAAVRGAPDQVRLAREIGWAVTAAARHVPFKAVCLPQALAARIMLRRRGVLSVMHFGAGKGRGKPIAAHAWLDAAGIAVTGYPQALAFAEIACFV
jgi:Transglutaminase-like superfamily